ncbi:MAG TPA: acyl-CoA dehydrogenase, partial [Thiotrichales bacterium]|nr:acyl-CoA dehydrogenase [Thiotrichales bacterium]
NQPTEQPRNWRLRWISEPLLKIFRRVTPRMSQTEREALDAGSVWWDGELFSGRPQWKKLRQLPAPRLSAEEQAYLDGPVDELCAMLNDWEITAECEDLPPEAWAFIKKNGFFSLIIPKSYGGLDYSALAHSAIVMKIATRSITAAVSVMVPNSLGPAKLLLEYGTEEQKNHYLPRLAAGEEVPCFALTSPHAGSDAGAIPDFGIVCRQDYQGEKDVLGMRLTWEKRYITLGPVATLLGLAFKLYDPEQLLGDETDRGITLALIPTDTEGVNIGRRHNPLNLPFMTGPNSGKDVFVPLDWIIGGEQRIGQGWRMLMECLADGRGISLPALSTGAGKLAARGIGAYARIRTQFKLPIGRFEGVEEALARIGGYTYMMDAARTLTATALDRGEKPSVISAIVKYHLTERMRTVVNDAMDILGGAGICLGPRNIMGRAYQGIPISITVEGANILTRSMIIFGQGAIRSHPYVFKEMEAISEEDPDLSLEKFDRALFGHMRFVMMNSLRTLFHGLTSSLFIFAPGYRPARRYYQHLTRMSAAFALLTDAALMTLGGTLKRKESLSARLGDVLSHLYLASAVLKRFEDQGSPKSDQPLLHWSLQYSLSEIQKAIDG